MKPEHNSRRALIREWMSLPQSERRTAEQASAFAAKAATKPFPCSGDRFSRILVWLTPRLNRA
ncbi:MAG: hypothetical protein WA840_18985, partial [Caulobacteraceae bacterium]